jgi:hypothetical protein
MDTSRLGVAYFFKLFQLQKMMPILAASGGRLGGNQAFKG